MSPLPGGHRKAPRETSQVEASLKPPEKSATTDIGPIDSVFGFHMQRASFVFAPNARSEDTRGTEEYTTIDEGISDHGQLGRGGAPVTHCDLRHTLRESSIWKKEMNR